MCLSLIIYIITSRIIYILSISIFCINIFSTINSCIIKINIITSDIAPNITGILDIDAANMLDILDKIIEFSKLNLVNNGILVSKIFHNSFDPKLKSRLRQNFKMVKLFKPEASRRSSSEIYIVCTGFFPSEDSEK